MAQNQNIYNSDKTRRSCPHGASVDYPVGTVHHVKVGDRNCVRCHCFNRFEKSEMINKEYSSITCCYPNFNASHGVSDNQA